MHNETKMTFLIGLNLLFIISVFFCYTLPVILVYLNLGHIIAEFTSYNPWLVTLSKSKFLIFLLSGLLLLFSDSLFRKQRNYLTTHMNTEKKYYTICNKFIFNILLLCWVLSFIFAYLLTAVLIFLDTI